MYVLQCELATRQRGVPVYFEKMTQIGPCYTESLDDAEKFNSEQDAMQSPAFTFSWCFFEPKEIKEQQQ